MKRSLIEGARVSPRNSAADLAHLLLPLLGPNVTADLKALELLQIRQRKI